MSNILTGICIVIANLVPAIISQNISWWTVAGTAAGFTLIGYEFGRMEES